MNKFILSALAVSVASAPSIAGSETDDWAGLDQDLEALASSLAQGGSGASVSGFLRSSYNNSGDSFVDLYTALKDAEYAEFQEIITPWEREILMFNV